MNHDPLIRALQEAAGPDAVRTDETARREAASDLYSSGPSPVAVVRPDSAEAVASAVTATTSRGYAVIPRGGGLSYTGGYVCGVDDSVLFDLSALNRIREISAQDMFVVAEAGVTWKQLYDALKPQGLRLPFFGTFSGAGATVGGGLSHGALFFGSARYGSAADIVLGLEVAGADGSLIHTGQWALRQAAKPVFRNFGPDLTGLFLHDGGALGVKTTASLRLIRAPAATDFASFAFETFQGAALALSEIARAGIAEDAFVLDSNAIAKATQNQQGMGAAISAVRSVVQSAGSGSAAVRALVDLIRGGRSVAPAGTYTVHCVMAGSSEAAVAADRAIARRIAVGRGGLVIAGTVPRIARAEPFANLNAVLGQDGARWAALNAKVAHSDAVALIDAHQALMARRAAEMAQKGVTVTYLLSALGTYSFSFESVFHWRDEWLPLHIAKVDPQLLTMYSPPQVNSPARALVAELREDTINLFRQVGAASNQIGRAYPYVDALNPAPAGLIRGLKTLLDPEGLMNPGVLGLATQPSGNGR
jgi:FAD/FMN-containing dehydrogenase